MNPYQQKLLNRAARYFPKLIWRNYIRAARQCGLDRLYLILSFDCDTPEDAKAARQLDAWLRQHQVKATYAVPGVQLEQSASIYRRLFDTGAQFINHGGLPHAEWRGDAYTSITFYHQMTSEAVVEDIERGHEIVSKIIGCPPVGFRAPHFGYFQADDQLALQYGVLRSLGYSFSTSTVPRFAMRYGPVFDVGGLYEIPVSGSFRFHLDILDSWGYLISPQQPVLKDLYAAHFIETIDRLLALKIPGVLNLYADPAHVYQSDAFYRAVSHALNQGISTLHYPDLIALVKIDTT